MVRAMVNGQSRVMKERSDDGFPGQIRIIYQACTIELLKQQRGILPYPFMMKVIM